ECLERVGVEGDLVLLVECAGKFRVEEGSALELEFEVAAVPADRDGAEQNGGREVLPIVAPLRETDREVDRLDTADGAKLDALDGDLVCGRLGAPQGKLITDQVRQQRGVPGDELRQPSRVGRAQLYARARLVDEVE